MEDRVTSLPGLSAEGRFQPDAAQPATPEFAIADVTASGRRRSLIICYHAVSAAWRHPLAVPLPRLERQVRSVLRRGYRPGTAADVLSGRGRLLHVTFDDAFESVWNAVPALETLGVPVTVFACAAYAEGGLPFDVRELRDEVAAHPRELETMSWEGLRSLAERGVEIGSHTVNHPHLCALPDCELEQELRDSRSRVEDEVRRRCRFLAYPYGEHDERVENAARHAGYDAAFGLARSTNAGRRDHYAVPRVDLYRDDNLVRTALKTSRLYPAAVVAAAAVRHLT
jgi:peptidoglycan/xylan/chitin deacetylase (PgdA/CDA1 family)